MSAGGSRNEFGPPDIAASIWMVQCAEESHESSYMNTSQWQMGADMESEYRKLAQVWEAIDYSDNASVHKCNKAADRMRKIVCEAESQGPDAIRRLLPLLDEPPANKWLAHHLVELASIDLDTEDRCFKIVKGLAASLEREGGGADAIGENYWLKEWKTKKGRR